MSIGAGALRGLAGATALAVLAAGCAQTSPPAPPPLAPVSALAASARCADLDFPIYFQDGSDQLTPAARQVLSSAVTRVRGCRITSGEIVGLASAGGSVATADALSQRRAVRVAEALTAAGVPGPALQLKAGGEAGATGPRGHAAPLHHAAEVFLHFQGS